MSAAAGRPLQGNDMKNQATTFAGIRVASDLKRRHFFFLYLNTLIMGMLMVLPAILQPAFLKDIIRVSPDYFGYINGFLQSMSQLATLSFVGVVGVISDRVGRKILALIGFCVLFVFYYLLGMSNEIAAALHVPAGLSSRICAALAFAPSRAAEFADFSPGLLTACVIRLVVGIGIILVYPQFITMVADYTGARDRGKGMALNGLMLGLASIIVFAAIAPLGRAGGVEALFAVAALLAAVGGACTLLFLKERRAPVREKNTSGLRDLCRVVMKSPAIRGGYICALVSRADIPIMATFTIAWAVRAGDSFQMTAETATQKGSVAMIVMSVVSFLAFPVIGRLLDRGDRALTLVASLLCAGTGMLIAAAGPSPFGAQMLGSMVLIGFGVSGAVAGINTLVAGASPRQMLGSVLGGLNTMPPLGMLFFLQAGGYLFDVLGPGWAFGLKGSANLLLAVWLIATKDRFRTAPAEAGKTGTGPSGEFRL